MMSWDYRVVKHVTEYGDCYYHIHEIYSDEDKINCWIAAPSEPSGATLDELREDMARMLAAFEKPVLNAEDLPGWK